MTQIGLESLAEGVEVSTEENAAIVGALAEHDLEKVIYVLHDVYGDKLLPAVTAIVPAPPGPAQAAGDGVPDPVIAKAARKLAAIRNLGSGTGGDEADSALQLRKAFDAFGQYATDQGEGDVRLSRTDQGGIAVWALVDTWDPMS